MSTPPPGPLSKEVASLVQRLRIWTPTRWQATAEPCGTRADLVRHLAQWFADQAAGIEGRPRRQLPVLTNHLLLPDQLAVTGDDLVRAQPASPVIGDAIAHLLVHRLDLLSEPAPTSLGGPAAEERGRTVCSLS